MGQVKMGRAGPTRPIDDPYMGGKSITICLFFFFFFWETDLNLYKEL